MRQLVTICHWNDRRVKGNGEVDHYTLQELAKFGTRHQIHEDARSGNSVVRKARSNKNSLFQHLAVQKFVLSRFRRYLLLQTEVSARMSRTGLAIIRVTCRTVSLTHGSLGCQGYYEHVVHLHLVNCELIGL